MGRYGDINRGPELNKAYLERQTWLQKSADQKQAAYKLVAKPRTARVVPERVPAYIRPFNLAKNGIFYETRGLATTQTGAGSTLGNTAKTIVGPRVLYDPPTGDTDTIIDIRKYQFARLSITTRTGPLDPDAKSRITGRPYAKYPTDTVSTPFGKLTADVNYQDAVDEIKDSEGYKTFIAVVGNRAGFTPEG